MNTEIIVADGVATLKVEGRIDTVTAKEFETATKAVLAEGTAEVVIDCGELSYVSSSGLRVFLMLQKSANAGGIKLRITNMVEAVKHIFKITGFASILTIE